MHLTGLDFVFWAAGFLLNLALLFTLWCRRRARRFPFFTALITLNVVRTILLYLVMGYAKQRYFYTYWTLAVLDTMLQLCVIYEIASLVFRPLNVWARDVRKSAAWLVGLSITVALGLTWLASPPAHTWMQSFVTKGNLFAATLMSEFFVAMMALSVSAGLSWRPHAAKIAQGLGTYALLGVLIETAYTYFGRSQVAQSSILLSHIRMAVYLGCVIYWIITLYPDERPARELTREMREKLFTLQARVAYDLEQLRSRKKS
jgi:hypothetical protein